MRRRMGTVHGHEMVQPHGFLQVVAAQRLHTVVSELAQVAVHVPPVCALQQEVRRKGIGPLQL